MISKELLELLACPLCKGEIKPVAESGEWLYCQNPECGCRYRIEDDIPIMLIDEARHPCPKCGAERVWDEAKETLRCPKCGTALTCISGGSPERRKSK